MTLGNINKQITEIENSIKDINLCQGTASTYTRITGYYRSTENFNNGKRQEYLERLEYRVDEEKAM